MIMWVASSMLFGFLRVVLVMALTSTSDSAAPERARSWAAVLKVDVKAMTKTTLKKPNNMDEATHMIKNLHLLLKFMFGEEALLTRNVFRMGEHMRTHHVIYDTLSLTDKTLPTQVVFHVDSCVQHLLRTALSANSINEVDFGSIEFDFTWRQIQNRSFQVHIPPAFTKDTTPEQATTNTEIKGDK